MTSTTLTPSNGFEDVLGSGGVLLKRVRHSSSSSDIKDLVRPEFKQRCTFHLRGRILGQTNTFVDCTMESEVGENVIELVPPGVMLALRMAGVSEVIHVQVDSRYGYGSDGHVGYGIPPDALLEYEIEMLDVGEPHKEPADMSMDELEKAVVAYKSRGNEYFGWNQLDRALRCFKEGARHGQQAIEQLGGDEKANSENQNLFANIVACLNNIATVFERQGKLKEAKDATVQVLLADPTNLKALLRGCRISLQQGEHEEAVAAIKVATKLAPDNAAVREMDHKVREAIVQVKKVEKERWGGFLKPAPVGTAAATATIVTSTSVVVEESEPTTGTTTATEIVENVTSHSGPRLRTLHVDNSVMTTKTEEISPPPPVSMVSNGISEDDIAKQAPLVVRLTILLFPSLLASLCWLCWQMLRWMV